MKTMSVEIERRQTLRCFVNVPDHWTRTNTRGALTMTILEEIAMSADHYDWDNGDGDLKIAALYETADPDQIDYEFPDEPAPPHPDQLAMIPTSESAL